jgi:molybdopterin molybdotransferase
MLPFAAPVGTEVVPLESALGRVCAADQVARENYPAYDRSPFDGYAVIAEDTVGASRARPVTLKVIEEVPAGTVPTVTVTPGHAVKLMTGAPIPIGANAVTKFETTEFTSDRVTLFEEFGDNRNVIPAGEDVRIGAILAPRGSALTAPMLGTLAAQGIVSVEVYHHPRVGIISTGSEVTPIDSPAILGKLRDSNRYTLHGYLTQMGCEPVVLGLCGDDTDAVAALVLKGVDAGLAAIVSTGGASVGDYDFTAAAFERVNAELLAIAGAFRPGGALVFARCKNALLFGLSGNPASAVTTLLAVCAPAIRKLRGLEELAHRIVSVKLAEAQRTRGVTRLVRGTLDPSTGVFTPHAQGNGMLTSWVGCDVIAVLPDADLDAGATVDALLL